jgi:hypothetical protein
MLWNFDLWKCSLASSRLSCLRRLETRLGHLVSQCFSNCGLQRFARWSARGFERKKNSKIVSDTERMKKTPMHVCAETVFVGSSSTESRWISSFHTFLSFSHYFRKCFKLVYRKNVVVVTLTIGIMFLLFTCLHFWVWGILRRCTPTAYEMVRACWKFQKHFYPDLRSKLLLFLSKW